jgi:hypothetical protein
MGEGPLYSDTRELALSSQRNAPRSICSVHTTTTTTIKMTATVCDDTLCGTDEYISIDVLLLLLLLLLFGCWCIEW